MRFLLSFILLFFSITAIADAQDDNAEPPYGMEKLQAYSVFVDAYRSDDFELAIDYGEWMLKAQPREIEGHAGFSLERQFARMIEIYTGAAEKESDPTETTRLLEKAEGVFKEAFDAFDNGEIDKYDWNMRMGRFYHEYHENLNASMDDAVAAYENMYELDTPRFTEEGDGFFASLLLMRYASEGQAERANEMIEEIEPFASIDLMDTIDEVRESLFESPQDRIDFIESRVADAEGAEREEMLRNLVDLYDETGQSEQAVETAIALYEMNPSYENTRAIANIYLDEGEYGDAIEFLEEMMEIAEGDGQVEEAALLLAESHQQLNDLQTARDYVNRAVDVSQNPGEAYLRMASIYAATISQCTGGDALERHDRTVYWLVLDYLDKAKEADPSLASTAESRAESYAGAMPSSEDKFFSGWEDGDSFRIDGSLDACYDWVNETTTVR